MNSHEKGETVVISATNKNSSNVLADPATSMNIVIDMISPRYTAIITSTAMTKDSTGLYHYDFQTASQMRGEYKATVTATDGAHITKTTESFLII